MQRRSLLVSPFFLAVPAKAAVTVRQRHGGRITLETDDAVPAPFEDLLWRWIEQSADAVAMYYGRFPVPEVYVHVVARNRAGVGGGQTFPGEVPVIRIRAGLQSAPDQLLKRDWEMVHEMVHLAFPWMELKHNWMAEGLAVYVESIARLQAGHMSRQQVWGEFIRQMPKGLPQPGDGGYEVTVNWGRTYWGGALFCLLADIRIRQETGNRFGLQHALRAINAERDFRREWDFRETLAIGDAATGRRVLVTQFDEMKNVAVSPDLEALWQSLGVTMAGTTVAFDDGAALAGVRKAIETVST